MWLVGVVSRRWVSLVGVGGNYGCGYWVWLLGRLHPTSEIGAHYLEEEKELEIQRALQQVTGVED